MKILIVKTSALGDLVHVFPVIDFLKTLHPDASIDWVVEKGGKDLLEGHPGIRKVLVSNTKNWRKKPFSKESWKEFYGFWHNLREETYDVLFDFQGNIKSGLIAWAAHAKHKVGFARKTVPEWPNLFFTSHRYNPPAGKNIREDYLHLAESYFKTTAKAESLAIALKQADASLEAIERIVCDPRIVDRKTMIVCQGSNWSSKQLKLETLQGFLQKVNAQEKWGFLFLWGTTAEKAVAQNLEQLFPQNSLVVERLPIPAVQELMKRVDLVFSVDSLPLHLAGTTGTSSISVFGPSSADKYQPLGVNHRALQGACPYGNVFEKRCPILRKCPTAACIKNISSDELFHFFNQLS